MSHSIYFCSIEFYIGGGGLRGEGLDGMVGLGQMSQWGGTAWLGGAGPYGMVGRYRAVWVGGQCHTAFWGSTGPYSWGGGFMG